MAKTPGMSVVGLSDVIEVTLSADTSQLQDNDVIAAPQEIAGFFSGPGRVTWVHSIVLQDGSDQAQDIELVFLNADGSIGNENAAYAPTDAVADTILGTVLFSASEYSDATNSQQVTKTNVGLMMKGTSTSVWIGAVCRSGTPTYGASALKLKIGVSWD
jgi:hypothetical protein